jgi:regulator of cell morphogenesis and NO signaling
MIVQKENKIGDIVAENFRTAKIFEGFGLDFCCGGKKTIETACMEKGISADAVIEALENSEGGNQTDMRYDKWSPDFLADYIVNNHHTYVLNAIPAIEQHLRKVISKHGEKHPQMEKVGSYFTSLKYELTAHMVKEEKMLFPYIKKMYYALQNSVAMSAPPFGSVGSPIKVMELEHEAAGSLMKQIGELTNNFTPPEDACTTFRILLKELDEFEQDLHMHIHLENNILFPKASELELKLSKSYSLA